VSRPQNDEAGLLDRGVASHNGWSVAGLRLVCYHLSQIRFTPQSGPGESALNSNLQQRVAKHHSRFDCAGCSLLFSRSHCS
jgi:hypothetical protein